jgi:uncharacterized protein YceK
MLRIILSFALVCALSACSGVVTRPDSASHYAYNGERFSAVKVEMTQNAQTQLSDNATFQLDQLKGNLEERLNADGLLVAGEKYRVQVAVKEIRVRSTFSAIMWGFMAGDDHIQGEVTILGADDLPIHTFDVKASYALGGFAGGQDGMRMNWLYRRFAELTSEEIRNVNKKQAKS